MLHELLQSVVGFQVFEERLDRNAITLNDEYPPKISRSTGISSLAFKV